MRAWVLAGVVAAATVLAGCGGEAPATDAAAAPDAGATTLANGMTVKQQIEARQASLKDLGASFKTINDTLKTNAPDVEAIKVAAAKMSEHGQQLGTWFPEGTGPEAGVKTEALANIWTDRATFDAAAEKVKAETAKLAEIASTGDVEAIKGQIPATGGSCKGCHDTFRLKKN